MLPLLQTWDLLNQTCGQTIDIAERYYPENRFAVTHFNKKLNKLVGGANDLKGWPLKQVKAASGLPHTAPVTALLYNPIFEEVSGRRLRHPKNVR